MKNLLAMSLLDVIPGAAILTNAHGSVVALNKAASRFLFLPDRVENPVNIKDVFTRLSGLDAGECKDGLGEGILDTAFSARMRHSDGQEFEHQVVVKHLQAGDDHFMAFLISELANSNDISEEHDAEKAFQSLVVASSDDAIIRETVDGVITSWNGGAERMFGFSAEEVIGRATRMFIVPEGDIYPEDHLRNAIANNAAELPYTFEALRRHKDGSPVNVLVTLSPIQSSDGGIIGIANVKKNISERKIDQSRLESIINAIPSGIVTIDANGEITRVNEQVTAIFGYGREEMIGFKLEKLLPERYRRKHVDLRGDYVKNPQKRLMGQGMPLMGLHKNGAEIAVEVGLSKIPELSGDRYMAIITDVSVRVETERMLEERRIRLERSNEELAAFAYVASHDLKSPLRGIDQLATWIVEDLPEHGRAAVQEHVVLMQARIRRMEKLLDDLLAYSRAGRVETTIETVSLGQLARDTFNFMTSSPDVHLELGTDLPVFYTYSRPLGQILQNLFSNAIKHSESGSCNIRIDCHDAGRGFYEIAVKDDGPGIDPKYHERVFGMFKTLKPRDKVEGSGMGLALVKKLVEMQNGTVVIDSSLGAGCTIKFLWPKRI